MNSVRYRAFIRYDTAHLTERSLLSFHLSARVRGLEDVKIPERIYDPHAVDLAAVLHVAIICTRFRARWSTVTIGSYAKTCGWRT